MSANKEKFPLANLAVLILTYNEEANIAQALDSVQGWARQIFLLDSFSTDRTLEIAARYRCTVVQNPFENYSMQRNYALNRLPIDCEWVLFLDADEWLPTDLRIEITDVIDSAPKENGFYINRRFIWMGKWIKRGYYPTPILRFFRHGMAVCEDRTVNEHLIIDGTIGYLKNDFIHEDHRNIAHWIAKHNHYATLEAEELVKDTPHVAEIEAKLWGTQAQRKRWLRQQLWARMPPLIRPLLYFFYRYVLRLGFMEGKAGFIYHFLQALWFPMLIDMKYIEMKYHDKKPATNTNDGS